MFFYTIVNIVVAIIVLIALTYLLFQLYVLKQGNEEIVVLTKRRTPFVMEDINFNQVVLSCDIPFVNRGKQNGTIMDLYPRHLLPQEQFDSVRVESWTMDVARERQDGYWESIIIEPKKGGTIRLYVVLSATTGNIKVDTQQFPGMNIDIVYQVVGRTDWHISKNRLTLSAEELQNAMRQ